MDEITIRSVTTVRGGMLSSAVLVAINEAAQKKQAATNAILADPGNIGFFISTLALLGGSFFPIFFFIRSTPLSQYNVS